MARSAFSKKHIDKKTSAYQQAVDNVKAKGYNPTLDASWVNVDDCFLDLSYQRPSPKPRVKSIARNFNPDAFGVIYVSKRDDGRFAILDGGTRWSAMKEIGWTNLDVPAVVFEGMTVQQEAELWQTLNVERSKPRLDYLFNAAITAEDYSATEVKATLDKYGITYDWGINGGADNMRAIGSAWKIVEVVGTEIFERVICLSLGAWPKEDRALHGGLLKGMALLLNNAPVDDKIMAKRLATTSPDQLISKAALIKSTMNYDFPNAIAVQLTDLYNYRLKLKLLPQWQKKMLRGK